MLLSSCPNQPKGVIMTVYFLSYLILSWGFGRMIFRELTFRKWLLLQPLALAVLPVAEWLRITYF
jgi:hypothetical protein